MRIHSAVFAQVAQVAERICSVLFEQRVFGIIGAYATHMPLIYSETDIKTSLLFVKPCHIAVANNIIYIANDTYAIHMYNMLTNSLTIGNFAYSHWANRKLEPIKEVETVCLSNIIDDIHIEGNSLIVNSGCFVIKYADLVSCCYVFNKNELLLYFNKIMYRITKAPNGVNYLFSDCKAIELKYQYFRLYVAHYIVVTEIVKGPATRIHIYDRDLIFIHGFTLYHEPIKKVCTTRRFIYTLGLYGTVYIRELATEKNTYITGGAIDICIVGDILYILSNGIITKYEFS